ALILLTWIRKVIEKDGAEFSRYAKSYRDVLRRVTSFSKISFRGKYKPIYSTPTKGARKIFKSFGIDIPTG
ncbi:MAG: hypothetical protein ACPKOP_01405, partial [Sphaerochaetaceae bacterium]